VKAAAGPVSWRLTSYSWQVIWLTNTNLWCCFHLVVNLLGFPS